MKNKFGFILVNPQLGENIGACARSMKNFNFKKLNIATISCCFVYLKIWGRYKLIRRDMLLIIILNIYIQFFD